MSISLGIVLVWNFIKFFYAILEKCINLLSGQCCFFMVGCFKSARNFMYQKLQHFWADSEYLGKINTKIKFQFFFQCLALPKGPQSFGQKSKLWKVNSNFLSHPRLSKFALSFFGQSVLQTSETVLPQILARWASMN